MDACARGERDCRLILAGDQIVDVQPGDLEPMSETACRVDFQGVKIIVMNNMFVRAEKLPEIST